MKYYLPAILCTIAILWLSTMSSTSLPESLKDLFSSDKLGHAIAYGTMTFFYYWGANKSQNGIPHKWLMFIAICTASYGILLEIVQYTFFPNRYFEVLDILANIMGILISYVIFKYFFHKTKAP